MRSFWHWRRGKRAIAREIDEELRLHLEMRTEELKAHGLSPEAARREALRQFGDLQGTRDYCRQQDLEKEQGMQRGLMLDELAQDLRVGLRGLLRAPLLTLTIIATVGLGIGATTVIFSTVDAALLRPLPYADSAQLMRLYTDSPPNRFPFSVVDWRSFESQQTKFARVAAYANRQMAFTDGRVAERLSGRIVSWGYFGLLGIAPSLGRDFTAADTKPGAPRAVIVSRTFWLEKLGGRTEAIGQPVRFDGLDYTLTGVLPATNGPLERGSQFFIAEQWDTPTRKGPFFLAPLGRLRPDLANAAGRAEAAAELRAINQRLFPIWKSSYQDSRATWSMVDLQTWSQGDLQAVGALALIAVALVWIIACTNASNLLIARVTSRRQELAVRTALGASRGRIVRYLLTESALLSSGAAIVGVAIAWTGLGLVRAAAADYIPRSQEIALDATTGLTLLGLTLASALLFGLIPAVHGSGGPLDEALRSWGRWSTGGTGVRRMRRLLVGGQFAITTPLLIVAGLLLVSLSHLARVDVGFDSHNVLTGSLIVPQTTYREPGRVTAFWDALQTRIEALPGVASVAYSDGRPPADVQDFNNFDLEDKPTAPGQSQPVTPWLGVSPEYFKLMGLTLREGRLFDGNDGNKPNLETIIVDEAWAHRFFPNGSAIGKRLKEGGCTSCPWTTVVGVVGNVKYAGLDKPDEGSVYWPILGRGVVPIDEGVTRFRFVLVRTAIDPATVLPGIRQAVRELDPTLPFTSVATLDERIADALEQPRSLSFLVGGFAIVALILSVVGIYGVMAYYVQQHAKDISIRLALGGSQGGVMRLIVGQGMTTVMGGVALGLIAAFLLARLLSTLLFGVAATDVWTFAGVTSLLLGVALAACCIPAGRAVSVEPANVLRND